MDRNSITGIVLIGLILIVFSVLNRPSQEEIDSARRRQDSLEIVRQQQLDEEARQITTDDIAVESPVAEHDTVQAMNDLQNRYGDFALAATGSDELYIVENEHVRLSISSKGGRPWSAELKEYQTHDSLPLLLFEGDDNSFGLNFFAQNRSISTNELYFQPVSETPVRAINDGSSLSLRLYADENRYIEYIYSLAPGSFMVDFNINLVGMDQMMGTNAGFIDLRWEIDIPGQERGQVKENEYSTIQYKFLGDEIDKLSERSDSEQVELRTRLKWIAFKQQFFSSVLIAEDHFSSAILQQSKIEDGRLLRNYVADIRLPLENSASEQIPMQFYFGPNHYNTLRAYSQDYLAERNYNLELEKIIPLGWGLFGWLNRFLIIPVFNFLGNYIASYGIIILLLTIFIKMLLFPLTYKSYVSTSKMRVLKPQIDELNEKIPKEKALERQQATMNLYKRAGVNPMGGCLPMLIQFPILIAMFRFFPTSFELRQESFLWAHDLSTYDSILDLPFTIPFYGSHVSLFTLLMTISTIIYTKMNSQMTAGSAQMPGMQTMMYMMPVMFLFIFNDFASALSYYYFLTNVITFGQQAIIKRFVDDEALLKKLNEHKKKPVSKSTFQKRLEEMAKKKGQPVKAKEPVKKKRPPSKRM
ncbi:MAG: membrane protein insertase YidC [Bacteroidales bacterium]